ncbi:metal ABC transporter permease [Bogoriella caseilytica]|uniref:ABC-type Mn2+/Zn2+ transport system permease subunit n=1 Tax=Bogoriella caseilytica TaxID=56055 RepID=A0A3N2BAJ4_9MICO|nr:metal ABC transporter permease [Bogoriella caseilytica]ROR72279.1 ABC-type Mn2+/Zn2+ transport system permease subunit [Bogoriella caseilytica]
MNELLAALAEPWAYGFMQRAFAAAIISAMACALLSCWLVLIGWSLMGDAVSHAVLPGVVLAYVLGLPFAVGALAFALVAVLLIGVVRERSVIKEDAAMGIVFTVLFALGLVLLSVIPSQVDLGHILFGNLLGVSPADLWQVALLGALVLAVVLARHREITLVSFDPVQARAIGLSPRRINALVLVLLAITAVTGLQAVGVVLVIALLIIPGATARLLTERLNRMLLIAPAVAAVCAGVGIYLSYWLNTATGPMVVLAQGAVFAMVYLATAVLRSGKSRRATGGRGGQHRPLPVR